MIRPTKTRTPALALGALLCLATARLYAGGAAPGQPGGPVGPLGGWDANDDGTLTAAEIQAGASASANERLAAFLAKYDSVPTGQTAGDGVITTEEATSVFEAQTTDWIEHVLETYDANDDGSITATELAAVRRGHGPHHLDDVDANDDGTVTTAELTAAATERVADRLERFLATYDSVPTGATQGDGSVTSAEALAVFSAEVGRQVEAFLARFDANDDGSVTSDEIAAVQGVRARGRGGRGGR